MRHVSRLADRINAAVGSPAACIGVVILVAAVLAWGATSSFGANWNQIMGAGSGILSIFLLVFLTNATNRGNLALQAKLDGLIAATDASNAMLGIEQEEEATILRAAQEIKESLEQP